MERKDLVVLMSIGLAGLTACAEFEVTNPHDSRYPQTVTIIGPDSAFSIGEVVTFAVSTNPAWTGTPPVWKESKLNFLVPLDDGRYVVRYAAFDALLDSVRVSVGPHTASHPIAVRQRVDSLVLLELPDTVRFEWIGASVMLRGFEVFDAEGTHVRMMTPCDLAVVRDPAVARIQECEVIAVGPGQTWVVASVENGADSVLVELRQIPLEVRCANPELLSQLGLRDSVQLAIEEWLDASRHPVEETPDVTEWLLVDRLWDAAPGESLELTSTGMVHTNNSANGGTAWVRWRLRDGSRSGEIRACDLRSIAVE